MAKSKTKTGAKKAGKKAEKIEVSRALERSPSHLLHRALQLALDIYAEETGPEAITQRQYAVLSAVAAHEGLTQTDLVRATGIDRSTLADLVARMIGKALLARQRSTADARANIVRLTDEGRTALDAAGPRVSAADARILKLLPARKRDGFLDVLRDLGRVAEQLAEDDSAATTPKPKKKKKDKAAKAEAQVEKTSKPVAKPPKAAPKAAKANGAKPLKAVKPAKAKKPKKVASTAPTGAV